MKKQASIFIVLTLAITVFSTSVVSAQIAVQAETSAQAEVNTGGGLGKGLNYMVKSILGDTSSSQSVPVPAAALMMKTGAEQDARVAPQAATMSLKSAPTAFNAEIAAEPLTDESLRAYIHTLLREDSRLQSVDTSDTHVRITYAIPSKAFKLVPVMLRVTAGAYVSGKTDVSYPWYSFALSRTSAELQARLTQDVEPLIVSESFSLEQQYILIDGIHVALAAEFGSSTGGDR